MSEKYIVYRFNTADENEQQWLAALLPDLGFDGFEESSNALKAYVPEVSHQPQAVEQLLKDNDLAHIAYEVEDLPVKNWNEEWEQNFEPVIISEQVCIRAPFHTHSSLKMDIVIEPKMSFGTGHHATTSLMVAEMLTMNFTGKRVLDYGSGTGVLAILAAKLNAAEVVGVDNEDWAWQNAMENAARNNCPDIKFYLSENPLDTTLQYDIILANINRNVILHFMEVWSGQLKSGGSILFSGILLQDEKDIVSEARKAGLDLQKKCEKDGWLMLHFIKK